MIASQNLTNVESRITSHSITIEIPSDFEWITRTVSYLQDQASQLSWGDSINSSRVMVPLHEALTNAIVHGNLEVSSDLKEVDADRFSEALAIRSSQREYASRMVQIVVDYNEHCITWSITDEGKGFDVPRVLEKASSEEPSLLLSGRGVMMMMAFMDDVRYDQGGRRVRMTLRNRNASPNGLGTNDWNDLQQTFGATDASFDVEVEKVQGSGEVLDRFAAHQVELHAFLDPLLASMSEDDVSDEDKREHTRHPFTGQFFTVETGAPRRPAYARNISHGGLCFLCKAPFESRLITVDLVLNGERVRIESEVVRCTELIPNVYDVGVRFLRSAE
jgi:anti-sigma regulatory factor (Ser/Thr protein kinase)